MSSNQESLPKSGLLLKLEETFQTNFGSEIDEFVLRGIWKQSSFNSLYNCPEFKSFDAVDKARFEGIIDSFFTKPHTIQIPKQFKEIELQVNNNGNFIPTPTNGYPICGNSCSDCCEDMCEHSICCNCSSVIYDVWDESLQAGNNNNINPLTDKNTNVKYDWKNLYGFCYNPCADCCEDVCEHAICCNCTASVVSHWYEGAEIENGGGNAPTNTLGLTINDGNSENLLINPLLQFEKEAFKFIRQSRRYCCFVMFFIVFVVSTIVAAIYYFGYYRNNYQ